MPLKPAPGKSTSLPSRLVFAWLTRLLIEGYRRPLRHEDLWELDQDNQCTPLSQKLTHYWAKLRNRTRRKPVGDANGVSRDDVRNVESPDGTVKEYVAVREGPTKVPSLWGAVARAFGSYFMIYAIIFRLFAIGFTISGIIVMGHMITFISTSDPREWWGYTLVVIMFLTVVGRTFTMQQYWKCSYVSGMRVRTALTGLVYRKALRLAPSARKSASTGEIINLMSVDARKLDEAGCLAHFAWVAPVLCAISLYFLWQELGASSLAGLFLMFLLVPANTVLVRRLRLLQRRQMKLKDGRLKLLNEVLNGIKVLKLYAWEESFEKQLLGTRNKELANLRQIAYLNAGSYIMWFMTSFMVALVTFATYVLSSPDHILDAKKAFVSLAYFNAINMPLTVMSIAVTSIIQACVSIKRIRTFLLSDELDQDNVIDDPAADSAVCITNGIFSWGPDDPPVLKGVNLSVGEGKLVAVVGRVGCGKSSLISAILGEIHRLQGQVTRKGGVAYVAQEAWIQNATLKENILFSTEFDKEKYDRIVNACQLKSDLAILPGGDETEIGEKMSSTLYLLMSRRRSRLGIRRYDGDLDWGINLSGGQKQRVSLARAVYQDSDIYLLDDPLSAVDAHVGKEIMRKVIGHQGELKNKTRILVTHSLAVLPEMDEIIVIEDGSISERGSYKDLIERNGSFAEFVATYLNEMDEDQEELLEEEEKILDDILERQKKSAVNLDPGVAGSESPALKPRFLRNISTLSNSKRLLSGSNRSLTGTGSKRNLAASKRSLAGSRHSLNVEDDKQDKKNVQIIDKEKEEVGRVKLAVIWNLLKVCGWFAVGLTLSFYVFYLVAKTYGDVWLSEWSNDIRHSANQTTEEIKDQVHYRLAVYGGLGAIQVLTTLLQSFAIATAFINGSRNLHTNLLKAIIRAPMSFFDTTPLGRIVNRFSSDLDIVDIRVPLDTRALLSCMSRVIVTLVIISYSTPIFIAAFIPLSIFYFFMQRFYICTSRQLQRIASSRQSPVYAHFGETLGGVSSIRAYGQQKRFTKRLDELADDHNIGHYPRVMIERWLGLWLEMLGNVIVFFAGLFVITSRESISPGIAGLSISYALQITTNLNYTVRSSANLENSAVAVERICEYAECPREAAFIVEDHRPKDKWPNPGKISLDNYSTRYRPGLDNVLKHISFDVLPGEKLGVVGRTGAGKSSLALALFRIIEPTGGRIIIDNEDVGVMGLTDLRSHLTIIPQEPVMFSGDLRMNLDPFNTRTDAEIWAALEQAHLKEFVAGQPQGLLHPCQEGGSNLSVGQRQLVCLARALLRNTKILVLDEATAAVDLATDDLIQTTIRTEFANSTVITIAHRLNTIMDYNRVLVLEQGEVKQLDTPENLLAMKEGLFYGMAKDSKLV